MHASERHSTCWCGGAALSGLLPRLLLSRQQPQQVQRTGLCMQTAQLQSYGSAQQMSCSRHCIWTRSQTCGCGRAAAAARRLEPGSVPRFRGNPACTYFRVDHDLSENMTG